MCEISFDLVDQQSFICTYKVIETCHNAIASLDLLYTKRKWHYLLATEEVFRTSSTKPSKKTELPKNSTLIATNLLGQKCKVYSFKTFMTIILGVIFCS